jgi:hypothetical protein
MQLTHETGKATIIQFMVLGLMNIADTIDSIVSHCSHTNGQCVVNMLTSIILYVGIIILFGVIAGLGYMAQEKRSKRLTRLLILSELVVFLFAAVNLKLGLSSHSNAFGLFTSLFDLIFSVWVISLAFRLMKAGGGRVVNRNRRRTSGKVPPL